MERLGAVPKRSASEWDTLRGHSLKCKKTKKQEGNFKEIFKD